jgi:hypothetical protein
MNTDEFLYDDVQQKKYNYKGKTLLTSTIEELVNLNNLEYIHICPYEVNNEGKYPFLKFLLYKNAILNKLEFLNISLLNRRCNNTFSVLDLTKKRLYEIVNYENYNDFCDKIDINGFYIYETDVFVFIDVTKCKLKINDIYSDNDLMFTLIYEIFTTNYVCNFKIDVFVFKFFNDNYKFCFLIEDNCENYEIPMVGYVGKPENKINFTYIFGETTKDKNAILGSYYYFTDYKNAFKDAYNCGDKNPGVVRFALFNGNTKYIENFPNDDIDKSEIKQQRLNDDNLDRIYEQLTIRISDHDGLWGEKYDSCYLGNILLENGAYLKNTPYIVLKDSNQQIPLSYHFINKGAYENKSDVQFLIL